MKLIVGLGNPGEKYINTRHNTGFMFVEKFATHPNLTPVGEVLNFNLDKRLKSYVAYSVNKGEKIILVKPDTFMNASGEAINKVVQYYKAQATDLIVAHDDIDIPLGEARVRDNGSSAGHKGVQNIIDCLGFSNFYRIRIGIRGEILGTQEVSYPANNFDTSQYVLQTFSDREIPIVGNIIDTAIEQLAQFIGKKNMIVSKTIKISG